MQYLCKLHVPAWDSTRNRAACEDILELGIGQKSAPHRAVNITIRVSIIVKLATEYVIDRRAIVSVISALR